MIWTGFVKFLISYYENIKILFIIVDRELEWAPVSDCRSLTKFAGIIAPKLDQRTWPINNSKACQGSKSNLNGEIFSTTRMPEFRCRWRDKLAINHALGPWLSQPSTHWYDNQRVQVHAELHYIRSCIFYFRGTQFHITRYTLSLHL